MTKVPNPTAPLTAADFARLLAEVHRELASALGGVLDVEVGLTALALRPHLTTPCRTGVHEACQLFCSCEDCREPCSCGCHARST